MQPKIVASVGNTSTKWKEQRRRVKRWLDRVDRECNLVSQDDIDRYEDDLRAFFMECYHFKDWLKHEKPYLAVEEAINASTELTICADLCNRAKHLVLDTKKSKPRPLQCDPSLMQPTPEFGRMHYIIMRDGNEPDELSTRYALDVARKAVEEWEGLLREWKLVTSAVAESNVATGL